MPFNLDSCLCSLLKVWNVNKCTGVVGVFNCQGAGWCKIEKKTRIHDASPGILTGSVQSTDVDALAQVAGQDWHGETIVYCQRSGAPSFIVFLLLKLALDDFQLI